MAVDPICGLHVSERSLWRLTKEGEVFYFCSEHCLKKFAGQHHLDLTEVLKTSPVSRSAWYKNKIVAVTAVLFSLCALSSVLSWLVPFRNNLLMYVRTIWWAIALGLFLGGAVDHFIPREYISAVLARPKKRTIFYAVAVGSLMSVCSHGILALSIELHKKGASTPSVVAFLLSSPWANLPLTLILIGFFGIVKALYIILCAIVIAIVTGLIFQLFEQRGLIEKNSHTKCVQEGFSLLKDLKVRFKGYRLTTEQFQKDARGILQGAVSLGNMVLWWIFIGIGLASLTGAYIPSDFLKHYMGPTAFGLIVTLLVATIIEVCSEGTAPLAFELFRQTGALGNSFVFLMAGVVTDYTEIGLLWHNVGRKTAIWLPVITVPQVLLLGILANSLF